MRPRRPYYRGDRAATAITLVLGTAIALPGTGSHAHSAGTFAGTGNAAGTTPPVPARTPGMITSLADGYNADDNGGQSSDFANDLNSNEVMDENMQNGSVDLWSFGTGPNQLWTPLEGSVKGFYAFHNVQSGGCLTDNGLQQVMSVTPCDPSNRAQQWSIPGQAA